jgi:hypothetical protein
MSEEREEQPRERKDQALTLFGRWIRKLCVYIGTTPTYVARRAGIDQGTISKDMREGKSTTHKPLRKTALVVCATLREIAEEKHKVWDSSWDTAIMNAAGEVTHEQFQSAANVLATIPEPAPHKKTKKYR